MKRGSVLKSIFSFLVMVPLMLGTTVIAAELRVPADYTRIQDAIDAAVPGVDVVVVADGTYSGNLLVQKAITIKSETGAEKCVIDCVNQSRGVTFVGPSASGAVLSGFTIKNGTGNGYGNWPGFGGAILFQDNACATISDCVISGNTAQYGGAIACIQSSPTINRCLIEYNSAMAGGGGVLFYDSSSPAVMRSIIRNNRTDQFGGGVYLFSASPAFASCLIADNSAAQGGGAFFMSNNCSPRLTHCTVSGNSVSEGGFYGGGGIFSYQCTPVVINSVLWGNEATLGPEIYLYFSSMAIDHSNLWRGEQDSKIYLLPSDQSEVQWGQGNIDQDPLFVAEGDYHLSQDSPCIDAGVPLDDMGEFDIDGDPRVMGPAPDMGADEFAVEEEEPILVVLIDIKPGEAQNKINLKSFGVLAVAVKTTAEFDVKDIDPSTVVFAGAKPVWQIGCDMDRDRDKDMFFFFRIKSLNLDENSTEATLSGMTKGGQAFEGTDSVTIIKPKGKAIGWRFGRR